MVCQCYDDGNIMCITDTTKGVTTQGPMLGGGVGIGGHGGGVGLGMHGGVHGGGRDQIISRPSYDYNGYDNYNTDYYSGNQTGNHPPRTSYANYHYPNYYDYNYYDHYNQVSFYHFIA